MARVCTALKIVPAIARAMPLPDVLALCEYWSENPPEHELGALFARVFTTWKPGGNRPMTPEEHRASLEERWNSGQALSPKQMFEAWGGSLRYAGPAAPQPADPADLPGIGRFPGAPPKPTLH